MLKGFDKKGNVKNVLLNEDGSIPVKVVDESGGEQKPTEIIQTSDKEIVLNASILTVSTESQTIAINKKVTTLSIANYSESGDIAISIGEKIYQIGSNLTVDFPINANIDNISLSSTEPNTKVQLIIKGVEQ